MEHDLTAAVALGYHVPSDVLQGIPRQLVVLGELIQNLDGDVHFADRAQRLGQLPDLPFRFPSCLCLSGKNRNSFAEPSGGHPRQVNTRVVPLDRQRELPLELARPSQQ
jgi:hypothetical protein